MPHTKASKRPQDRTEEIAASLPFLRRYARALTGSQKMGDRHAEATLEAILLDEVALPPEEATRIALFAGFHVVWSAAGAPLGTPDNRLSASAQAHMARLTPNTREALLLSAIEGFTHAEIARILRVGTVDVAELLRLASEEMLQSVAGRVMIIEDEAIIAMDIQAIVTDLGHSVTGIARTRTEAVALASAKRPDLILADIHLADNSSGIDAVNEILGQFPDLPVVFVTAFPERLLTGKRPEPAFLITKPFYEDQVISAVSQAMFFASTETLVR